MKIALTALFLLLFNLNYAQETPQKDISYGLEIQVVSAKIGGLYDVTFVQDRAIGFSLSGYAD